MTKSRRGSRHAFLRGATAEVHENLEAVIEARAYLEALPAYGQYLQRLHAFHRAFAGAIRSHSADLAGTWRLDAHESWLETDLEDLGLSPLDARARQTSSPRIAGRASAFGAAYVLFGSSLGARFLLKRADGLDLPEGRGKTYLASLALESDWPGFLRGLEAEPALSEPELLRGALETFESFRDHMTGSLVHDETRVQEGRHAQDRSLVQ